MNQRLKNVLIMALAMAAIVSAGCGPKTVDGRFPVAGKINFGGAPMDHGIISFQPVDPNGKTSAASAIQNGKYSITGTKMIAPGEYTVVVTCEGASDGLYTTTDPATGKSSSSPKMVSYVPADWGVYSTHKVTVKPRKNKLDFDIPREAEPVAPPATSDGKGGFAAGA